MVFLIMSVQTPVIVKLIFRIHIRKSLHRGGFLALFSVSSFTRKPLSSGAKEAENSSIHACITLSGKKRQSCIEKPAPIKVNVLMVLKRKEETSSLFQLAYARAAFAFSTRAVNATLSNTAMSADLTVDFNRGFFRPLMNLL